MNLTDLDVMMRAAKARCSPAPGVEIEVRPYNSPAGRGATATCTLTSSAGTTKRVLHYGPENRVEIHWNVPAVRTFEAAIIGAQFATLPPQIQLTFAEKFATVRTLVAEGMRELARAVVDNLETPPEQEGLRGVLVAAKQRFLFYLG